jgi:hypothetical protein
VLFQVADGSGKVAEVHLTWARVAECPPWPGSGLYDSLVDWEQDAREEWARNRTNRDES